MLRGLALAALIVSVPALLRGQPAATMTAEALLGERLGAPGASVARFSAGEILATTVPATAPNEIAAAGAMRGSCR